MKKKGPVLLLSLLTIGLLFAQPSFCQEAAANTDGKSPQVVEGSEEEKPIITELTDATFKNFLKTNEYSLILFYEPWCNNCKDFMPVFEEVAKSVKDKISVGKIRISDNRDASSDQGIENFPNLRIYVYTPQP